MNFDLLTYKHQGRIRGTSISEDHLSRKIFRQNRVGTKKGHFGPWKVSSVDYPSGHDSSL